MIELTPEDIGKYFKVQYKRTGEIYQYVLLLYKPQFNKDYPYVLQGHQGTSLLRVDSSGNSEFGQFKILSETEQAVIYI